MRRSRRCHESGFTIIELMVAMFVFSVVSVGFYQVLFSATSGSNTAEDGIRVSEEARLGFNRLVRDTREANEITDVTTTGFDILVDFDGNGTIAPTPADPSGSYERLTIQFNRAAGTVTMGTGPGATEVLVRGARCITDAIGCSIFEYSSSRLEFDTNGDGITSAQEVDVAAGNPSNWATTGYPDSAGERRLIDIVSISMGVEVGDSRTDFYAEAQLRNRR
jgi:prepilin-type N-terminal cleavage/methylation domain-containing protein